MRRPLIVLLVSLGAVMASGWLGVRLPQDPRSRRRRPICLTGDAKNRFAGTWRLVSIERLGPKGQLLPPPTPPAFGSSNPVGFIRTIAPATWA